MYKNKLDLFGCLWYALVIMKNTKTRDELKGISRFLNDSFRRYDDKFYWLNVMDDLSAGEKLFIRKGLNGEAR